MSAAFDILKHALMTLSKEQNLTMEQRALVVAIERTIAEWHELNPNPPKDTDGRREESGRGG